jgi:hypothetical protein
MLQLCTLTAILSSHLSQERSGFSRIKVVVLGAGHEKPGSSFSRSGCGGCGLVGYATLLCGGFISPIILATRSALSVFVNLDLAIAVIMEFTFSLSPRRSMQ